ncbi:ATR-interacting protein isoform X1 [Epinephelus fuscoguttatus]|uniref:ATR-interacting protein isoform X1 n=1 Tax=Epinephelus fuscoguttatus TaxID=293821 RepID=UPI0020D106D4|nr:ATR-interacting protein isoform X1 [Epinephelus fuscoguttatus]XP_049428331.1 ATR-interacting protein isoform X1 [Epinephelus fuscoguttatus]XP_049428340.1 ATR-interacting protein isoform X1 [Epinephelus fuscoguttatus]
MNYPPTKRLRGLNQEAVTTVAFDDPFGDDEDFTQDDLDEIDIIASQANTGVTTPGLGSKPGTKPTELARGSAWPSNAGHSKSVSRATSNHSRENMFGLSSSSRGNPGIPSREPLGNRQQQQQQLGLDRDDSYCLLEAQHAELKRKLKEVEEEIVLKNGEIRVLRDSLKGAQQEKETQRQNQIQLEIQRQKEQSDREKELNRKVQSLQSELQFKEAEINEIKTKLHSSDKNKTASPLPRHSPKVLSSLAQLHHGTGSSSSSPTGNGFITKESFGAPGPSRTTPVKTRRDTDRGASSSRSGDKQDTSRPDPFLSVRPAHLRHRGGVLLGLLLQQPLSPSSLGLSHLLSMSLTDIHLASSELSTNFLLDCDAAASVRGSGGGAPRTGLSSVQSLAITGLNMLSQSRPAAAASSRNKRLCPGAVLLLPLLDLHLSRLCQALDLLHSSHSAGSGGSNSTAASSLPAGRAAPAAAQGRLEEAGLTGFSVEDTGLAALRLLYLVLAHSDEAVEAVLSKESQSRATDKKTERPVAGVGLSSQNALLQSVLRLCEAGRGSGSQNEELVLNAMKTLCVLIERTPHTHTDRLQCVLQVLCVCLSADCRLQMVSGSVSVLTSMSDHQTLAQQLCSQHDPCVFLKLFQFIRTRPDNQAAHRDWILLDLQVVRLLSRLMTQRAESWTASQRRSCQCYTELVQTVVIVFHRQWLDLRGSQDPTDSAGMAPPPQKCPTPSLPWWCGPAASLLRECLLLLHWLLLHHGSFSESCRPLLHMYDQVIPAVRDTLRKIPRLSESEELALEEICRSEGDDTDDMDTDNGS